MAKENELEIELTRSVNFGGKYFNPGEILKLPKAIADELIDDCAAERVLPMIQSKGTVPDKLRG